MNIQAEIKSTGIRFRSYEQGIFQSIGYVNNIPVKFNNIEQDEILFILPDGFLSIAERTWIRHFKLDLLKLDANKSSSTNTIHSVESESTLSENLFNDFLDLFEEKVGLILQLIWRFFVKMRTRYS